MWRCYLLVTVGFVVPLLMACGEEYLSQDEEFAKSQYNGWVVSTYGKIPTASDCHVKAVRNYMDRHESLTGELTEIFYRLEDLTNRGVENTELPESDPAWFIEFSGIAVELTAWMGTYREMKVPIPMYNIHYYDVLSFAHMMKWRTDVAEWLMDENRTEESLGDALTRENEWEPKAKQEWMWYLDKCGDVWDDG